MKKVLIPVFVFVGVFFCYSGAFAQTTKHISTEQGMMKVDVTSEINNKIEFSIYDWDAMMEGTEYISGRLPIQITICITIASRKKECKSGIGFRCGLTECNTKRIGSTDNGRKANRTYSATYSKSADKITLTFNEKIDWDWLAE